MGCSYERDFRLCRYGDGHKIEDIILLVFFVTLENADNWVEIEIFGKGHEAFLRN